MLAKKRPFTTCGKLFPLFDQPNHGMRRAPMSLVAFVVFDHTVSAD
jgi:hypothetical protein